MLMKPYRILIHDNNTYPFVFLVTDTHRKRVPNPASVINLAIYQFPNSDDLGHS